MCSTHSDFFLTLTTTSIMSVKKIILTENAPKPIPVLSQAVVHNGIVYCSGQIGADPKTNQLVEGPIGNRTVSCTPGW